MITEFQNTSLKVVTSEDGYMCRIDNVDSTLVSKLNFILNSFYSGQINYFSVRDKQYICPETISFFRGFRPFSQNGIEITEREKADYFQKFFVVGEKGRAYREDILDEGIRPYFGCETIETDIIELLKFVNLNLERHGFKKIEMKVLIAHLGDDLTASYMFLLNLVHNIGRRWENKSRSPLVSASYGHKGFKTALHFAENKNVFKYSYIIFGFIRENNVQNYFFTKELNEKLGILNSEWYPDIHNEIILKDGIFPQNIFGVFEVDNQTGLKSFIINPYFYQLINLRKGKKIYRPRDLIQFISQRGIPVEQRNFEEFARELGYQSYGYRFGDGYVTAGRIGGEADTHLPSEPLR